MGERVHGVADKVSGVRESRCDNKSFQLSGIGNESDLTTSHS